MGKILLDDLRAHRGAIAFGVLCAAIFAAVFALYHFPPQAVAYPTLLCALLGAAMYALHFRRVWAHHRQMADALRRTADTLGVLPSPQSVAEADDLALIAQLRAEMTAMQNAAAAKYSDTVEYYTAWVHQIKTPIAAMHLTLQNEDGPAARRLAAELARIEQYVGMVLTFLRLDAPSTDYVIESVALDPLIRQTVRKFADEFIDRKLRLEYEPIAESVISDQKALAFVLEQVLSNALKYTPHGSIRIYLRAPRTLCVSDTGIGIAPEDLPRIFEKGYTGRNGRIDQRASGIGLYLCRRICTRLGHPIWAESGAGGTTLCIRLDQPALSFE